MSPNIESNNITCQCNECLQENDVYDSDNMPELISDISDIEYVYTQPEPEQEASHNYVYDYTYSIHNFPTYLTNTETQHVQYTEENPAEDETDFENGEEHIKNNYTTYSPFTSFNIERFIYSADPYNWE